jgi:hypothetical protein
MLGRLDMTVDMSIKAYTKLMKQIFKKKDNHLYMSVFGRVKPRFSSKALEAVIAQVLSDRNIPNNERFEDPQLSNKQSFKYKV